MSEERICSMCSGQLSLLGILDNTTWYRCVQCGLETGLQDEGAEIYDIVGRDGEEFPDEDEEDVPLTEEMDLTTKTRMAMFTRLKNTMPLYDDRKRK